jgi:hypothetical protein
VCLRVCVPKPEGNGRYRGSLFVAGPGRREAGSKRQGKEIHDMNRVWTEALTAVLVAATESLIEAVKKLKKKRAA